MTSRIQLEPEAQAFVEAAAKPPLLFTLGPEQGTVKNHISNILSRLGLRDRTQAAIYARENGWL